MVRAKPLILTILLAAALPLAALAQPTVHGSLSGTLGPGVYIVDGQCTIDAGNTLTIQPGTTFLFSGHYSFKVYGTLNAVGTESDSIVFKRQNPTSACEWSGILFQQGSSPNSALSYCYLEYAKYHVWPDYNGGGIYIKSVGVTISHCWIADCYASSGGGIYIDGAPATITDCVVINNSAGSGGGIFAYNSQNVAINNCVIGKNSSSST